MLRLVGVVLPLLMLSAVVLTANHYLVDAVAGAALVLACLVVVRGRTPAAAEVTLPAQRSGDRPARCPTSGARPGC